VSESTTVRRLDLGWPKYIVSKSEEAKQKRWREHLPVTVAD